MSQQIMQSSAEVHYPTLMRTSYGSQWVNAVGGDNTGGMNSASSNFNNVNGKCCQFSDVTTSNATNLSAVNNAISSIDSKIARNFK